MAIREGAPNPFARLTRTFHYVEVPRDARITIHGCQVAGIWRGPVFVARRRPDLAETGRDRYGKRLQLTRAEAAQPPAAISTTVPGIGPAAR